MATFPGTRNDLFGPTVFAAATRVAAHHVLPGVVTKGYRDNIALLNPSDVRCGPSVFGDWLPAAGPPSSYAGCREDRMGYSFDWFEKFHVIPSFFAFGNVLTTQQENVVVYSSYRTVAHTWTAFTNNAGDGTEMLNLPSFPYNFPPQTGFTGLVLEISPSGPPVVDSTLDFVFNTMTISPPITLNRLVLFDLPPELPYSELLQFLTEIQPHLDGGEHRISLRKNPRQLFEWNLILEDSILRSRIHNLLFDWHARVFGVPVWHEMTFTTSDISVSDLVVDVRTTSFADYRVGGLVLVYESSSKFDVLEIATAGIGATDITFTNGAQNAYDAGARVVPLRTGALRPRLPGQRFITDVGTLSLSFRVTDNDADLASTTGWDTYDGKVILNDVNSVGASGNSVSEEILRDIIVIDNEVGLVSLDSLWAQSKRRHTKTFWTRSNEELWKVRQLLHALRGRHVSFYMPTKGQDLNPTANLLNAGTSLSVSNVGYAKYVQNRQTRNIIQVVFNDGSPSLVREVTASSEVDAATESLTVDPAWDDDYDVSQIERIEYLELSRFDSDTIRFNYALGERTCRISSPVVTVFDA